MIIFDFRKPTVFAYVLRQQPRNIPSRSPAILPRYWNDHRATNNTSTSRSKTNLWQASGVCRQKWQAVWGKYSSKKWPKVRSKWLWNYLSLCRLFLFKYVLISSGYHKLVEIQQRKSNLYVYTTLRCQCTHHWATGVVNECFSTVPACIWFPHLLLIQPLKFAPAFS